MRIVFAAFALIIVGAVAVFGLQAALADAGQRTAVSDETFDPTAGTVQSLDQSGLANAYYNETVHVVDENGNPSYEGTDYEWFESNGTIKPLTGGNLEGDASATIDYAYRQTTESQRGFAAMLATLPKLIGPLVLVLMALAFVSILT